MAVKHLITRGMYSPRMLITEGLGSSFIQDFFDGIAEYIVRARRRLRR